MRPAQRSTLVAALALVLLTTLAYAPAFRAGFVWDDDDYVTRNPTLGSVDGLRRIWTEPGAVAQYYPLTFTTLWVEHRIWGPSPGGYHATNVALHAANAVLAWRLLLALGVPGAWPVAAVFALHPIQVESVAWITERKNVLSGLFYLGAMLAFVRWAGLDGRDRSRARDLWLGVALFLAALLSKTVTSTLPVIVLVLVWWRTGAVPRRVLGAMVPLVAVGAIFGALTASVERGHVGAVGAAWNQSFAERVLIAGRALWFYLGKLVWPHPLVFVYPRWDLDVASLGQWAFPVTAVAVGVAVIGFARRIGRAPAAVAMAYAVTLAPALGFLNVYPMRYSFVADHFAYLASLPVLALLVGGVTSWSAGAWPRQVRVGVGVATLGVLAVLTAAHAGAFADARTLWLDTLAKNPRATIAHVNLGLQSYQEGHLDDALALFDQGLAVEPDAADLWNDRGLTLIGLGRIPDALDAYEHAVRADPEHAESRNNYGNVLASLGRYDDARAQYEAAVQAHPRYAEAHNNLANILAIGGDARAAVAHYEAALAADPSYADAHRNLGEVALSIGDLAAACDHFGAALRLRSDDLTARVGLGRCLGARGRAAEAVAELRRVLTAAPDAGEAQLALAWILATARDPAVRRPDEALALAEAATAGVPAGDPRGLDTLAAAQASAGRSADAVRSAEQALDLARREAPTIAPAIEARLARYRAGEGWNEP